MISYTSLEEQVDKDFGRARRKAFFGRLMARLRGDPSPKPSASFKQYSRSLGAAGRVYLGLRAVALREVVGSVGRHSEFDGSFPPLGERARPRWERGVDRAFWRGVELPPVSLYKIGGSYLVEDGNHRVSVARYHGGEWIDAYVTEFRDPRLATPRPASRNALVGS